MAQRDPSVFNCKWLQISPQFSACGSSHIFPAFDNNQDVPHFSLMSLPQATEHSS
jgi:hypothetical protein